MNELSMHTSKVNFVIFYEAWFSNICWVTLPADITVCFGVTAVETHDTRLFSLFLKCSKIKGEKIYIWTYLPMRTSMKASMEIWEELVKFIQQKMEQVLPVVVSLCIFFFSPSDLSGKSANIVLIWIVAWNTCINARLCQADIQDWHKSNKDNKVKLNLNFFFSLVRVLPRCLTIKCLESKPRTTWMQDCLTCRIR